MRALTAALALSLAAAPAFASPRVKTGAEVLATGGFKATWGPRIGLITNRSAITASGVPDAELLAKLPGVKLAEILSPEHGYLVDRQGTIGDAVDPATGAPVRSLYGKTLKPTPEMLVGLDALVFDIQDVGARFYTFISTMLYGMQAARDAHLPFIVLDRPNPIGGAIMEGGVLEDTFASFTGPFPIPVRHGMTIGELAKLFNSRVGCKLVVVPMQGWSRSMWWDQTGLPWQKPSPAMKALATATVYPGVCFFEATNVDCRVGEAPFERFAAPWLDGDRLATQLNALHLPGVSFTGEALDPAAPRQAELWPSVPAGKCQAVAIRVTDREAFRPVHVVIQALSLIRKNHSDLLHFEARGFDRLAGTDQVRKRLLAGDDPEAIVRDWEAGLPAFAASRKTYLLYR